jgi:hypothetical protein
LQAEIVIAGRRLGLLLEVGHRLLPAAFDRGLVVSPDPSITARQKSS